MSAIKTTVNAATLLGGGVVAIMAANQTIKAFQGKKGAMAIGGGILTFLIAVAAVKYSYSNLMVARNLKNATAPAAPATPAPATPAV
jgi:small neutral amino acid transporter SnatA (MarC family)